MPSKERIISLFGHQPLDIYKMLLPEKYWPHGNEFLACLENIETTMIRVGRGRLFEGVLKTLDRLKARGYKIGIYSNGGQVYFYTLMDHFKIGERADAMLCIGDHPYLKKPALLAMVKDKLGVRKLAVVGDRHHDIEAARATGDVAIGAGYGFGGDEMEQADFVIDSIGELLELLPVRH